MSQRLCFNNIAHELQRLSLTGFYKGGKEEEKKRLRPPRFKVNQETCRMSEWLTWPAVTDVAINKILANGTVVAGSWATFVNIHFTEIPHETWWTAKKTYHSLETARLSRRPVTSFMWAWRVASESCSFSLFPVKKKNTATDIYVLEGGIWKEAIKLRAGSINQRKI